MKNGDPVYIEFQSTDASSAAPLLLKDANGNARTLLENERLLIDTLTATHEPDGEDSTVGPITVFYDSDDDGSAEDGELIASLANGAYFDGGCDGFACPRGVTPSAVAAGAGAVAVSGTGRIIRDGSLVGRKPTFLAAPFGQ